MRSSAETVSRFTFTDYLGQRDLATLRRLSACLHAMRSEYVRINPRKFRLSASMGSGLVKGFACVLDEQIIPRIEQTRP